VFHLVHDLTVEQSQWPLLIPHLLSSRVAHPIVAHLANARDGPLRKIETKQTNKYKCKYGRGNSALLLLLCLFYFAVSHVKWQRQQEKNTERNAKWRKIINGEIKQITKIYSHERERKNVKAKRHTES
jgi:hypothetical protein